MKKKYPEAEYYLKRDLLKIKLILQPTEHSLMYPVEIVFKNKECDVWVSDNIERLEAEDFPHCYKKDFEKNRVQLCLFRPSKFEWNLAEWIQDTIIPWSTEWLLYYELWLCTGIWYGGGEHPVDIKK